MMKSQSFLPEDKGETPSLEQHYKQLTDDNRMPELREKVATAFAESFERAHYVRVASIPIVTKKDDSVLFIGSTISVVKDVLIEGSYPEGANGVYLTQSCLRTKAEKYLYRDEWIPFGQSYFDMISVLSRPGRLDDVIREAVGHICDDIGVDPDRVKIRTTKELGCIPNDVSERVHVEYDKKDQSYYEWEYGIPGIYGTGMTVCIHNSTTDKWFDIGNIISVYDEEGKELGIEFGYGYEFFLTAVTETDQPLKFSRIYEINSFNLGMEQKYLSTLEATTIMRVSGARPSPGTGGVNDLYIRHLRGIQHMARSIGKTIEDVVVDMTRYLDHIGFENFDLTKDFKYMQKHENYRREFGNMAKRVREQLVALSEGRQPKQMIKDPHTMVVTYMRNRAIDPAEVKNELEDLERLGLKIEL